VLLADDKIFVGHPSVGIWSPCKLCGGR
jgi:hypothetical protein